MFLSVVVLRCLINTTINTNCDDHSTSNSIVEHPNDDANMQTSKLGVYALVLLLAFAISLVHLSRG